MVSRLKIFWLTVIIILGTIPTVAQELSPLEITTPDPLLPTIDRPLTSFERYRITEATKELDQSAKLKLAEGLLVEAFELWYRELRLQRNLGLINEIPALGRVGKTAWEQNQVTPVENITDRLDQIATETQEDPEILGLLAAAYQELGQLPRAIITLERLLELVELEDREAILNQLAQLHLDRLDYSQAAQIYEELLTLTQDDFQSGIYLQQLATIYTQATNPVNAIPIKEQLITTSGDSAALRFSLAQDYEAAKQPQSASLNYQQAYDQAIATQQYGLAAVALESLGNLYHSQGENQSAIATYEQLLQVHQQSYNLYGLMDTYDRLGQIHLQQQQPQKALAALEEGLTIAESLNYRQAHFMTQIEQLKSHD